MFQIITYVILSFIKTLVKNCKTIFLIKEDKWIAPLLAGINALLATNLIKIVVSLDVLTASIIAFSVNVIGALVSIIISKRFK